MGNEALTPWEEARREVQIQLKRTLNLLVTELGQGKDPKSYSEAILSMSKEYERVCQDQPLSVVTVADLEKRIEALEEGLKQLSARQELTKLSKGVGART